MDALHLAHLIVLGLWGGTVATEIVVELAPAADDTAGQRLAARMHYLIDLCIELPILATVLVTGSWLLARSWPVSSLHLLKIGAGGIAVAINLWCAVVVIRRHRRSTDPGVLRTYGRAVRVAAATGVPFGLVALYLGLALTRGWLE